MHFLYFFIIWFIIWFQPWPCSKLSHPIDIISSSFWNITIFIFETHEIIFSARNPCWKPSFITWNQGYFLHLDVFLIISGNIYRIWRYHLMKTGFFNFRKRKEQFYSKLSWNCIITFDRTWLKRMSSTWKKRRSWSKPSKLMTNIVYLQRFTYKDFILLQ